jgi:hypothetical protein
LKLKLQKKSQKKETSLMKRWKRVVIAVLVAAGVGIFSRILLGWEVGQTDSWGFTIIEAGDVLPVSIFLALLFGVLTLLYIKAFDVKKSTPH